MKLLIVDGSAKRHLAIDEEKYDHVVNKSLCGREWMHVHQVLPIESSVFNHWQTLCARCMHKRQVLRERIASGETLTDGGQATTKEAT